MGDETDGPDGTPDDERRAPFEDLIEALEGGTGRERSGSLDELSGQTEPPAAGDRWSRLERARTGLAEVADPNDADLSAARRGSRLFPSYPSRTILVAHGVVTTVTLVVGAAVVLLAIPGVIPEHLWILSLPFLALGLFGLVPILSWRLDIWRPRELR